MKTSTGDVRLCYTAHSHSREGTSREGEHARGAVSRSRDAGWHHYSPDGAAAPADPCVGLSGWAFAFGIAQELVREWELGVGRCLRVEDQMHLRAADQLLAA